MKSKQKAKKIQIENNCTVVGFEFQRGRIVCKNLATLDSYYKRDMRTYNSEVCRPPIESILIGLREGLKSKQKPKKIQIENNCSIAGFGFRRRWNVCKNLATLDSYYNFEETIMACADNRCYRDEQCHKLKSYYRWIEIIVQHKHFCFGWRPYSFDGIVKGHSSHALLSSIYL